MDQKSPLDHEKAVGFAYFACRDPAIHRLSVTPETIFAISGDITSAIFTRCAVRPLPSCLAHDRPLLIAVLQLCVAVEEFLYSGTGREHYRNLGARQKIRRTVEFCSCRALGKVCMCRFGTHTSRTECFNGLRSSITRFDSERKTPPLFHTVSAPSPGAQPAN